MDLLLDTHIFLWWQGSSQRLADNHRQRIRNPNNRVFVSVVAIWEIGIKRSCGKLDLKGSVRNAILVNRFELVPVLAEDGERIETLPWHHRDPFDRMLIAQAMERDLTIMTSDSEFERYGVPLLLV